MYVIKLTNGNLRVPHSAVLADGSPEGGRIIGQAYVEIGPDDPDYERLLRQALTLEELERKRRQWRDDDEALLREFEDWKALESDD
ncbi:MAG: hypothetical protein JWO67_1985 [Streptosporangiaceae bacterium]|jgi:hypothetical protein|nr:hypothetical protein [Streptosporangiaceae bacterium]